MPDTIRIGSIGDTVKLAQGKLNGFTPTVFQRLSLDGIFGPKTLARVQEFQRLNGLLIDGVVGPRTWDKLLVALPAKPQTGVLCANGIRENAGLVQLVSSNFLSFLSASSAGKTRSAFVGGLGPAGLFTPASSPFVKLTPPQIARTVGRFGSSIDFSNVFISPLLGIGSRPFTAAVTLPAVLALATGLSGTVLVMNCGTFTPTDETLLHELAHVWQSQHDSEPARFMQNSINCQAASVAFNLAQAITDPSVKSGDQFPVHFPTSAYAYTPGKSFGSYSCEQMANNLDHGDPAITAHVKGRGKNTVDVANISGLSATTIDDRRAPAVIF